MSENLHIMTWLYPRKFRRITKVDVLSKISFYFPSVYVELELTLADCFMLFDWQIPASLQRSAPRI